MPPSLTLTTTATATRISAGFSVYIPSKRTTFTPQICTWNNDAAHSKIKTARIFPGFLTKTSNTREAIVAKAQLQSNCPLIPADDHWGLWSVLVSTAAFGLWSGKTKIGSMISGPLVSILIGLAASNLRIVPYEAPAYSVVMKYLLPLAVPLLLFRANMRQLIQSTGRLLLAFLLGSAASVIGTLVAFSIVPMRSLGSDSWKIAAALMGTYIGGSVNYIAVSEALGASPSIVAAGVAADNVICAIYFMLLFALASRIPPETSNPSSDVSCGLKSVVKLPVLPTATAVAVSFAICKFSAYLVNFLGVPGGILPIATIVVVVLATALPQVFGYLAPSGETVSWVLMQVFFAVIGASGDVWSVISTAPSIFLFALIQVTVHLVVLLALGKLFNLELKLLLLASNANIGGPTTACGMATSKGWDSLIVPGILAGILGISIATFLSIALAVTVLKYM